MQGDLLTQAAALGLTRPVVCDPASVQRLLAAHRVTSLPWKATVTVTATGRDHTGTEEEDEDEATATTTTSKEEKGVAVTLPAPPPSSSAQQLMQEGLRASNEQDDFCGAARCFSALLLLDSTRIPASVSVSVAQEEQEKEQEEQQQRVRDALFNMASLLHMHGHVALALPLLLRLLQTSRGGGRRRSRTDTDSDTDMTAHAFLWSLARGCCLLPEDEKEEGERGTEETGAAHSDSHSVFLRGLVEGVYRSLGRAGDVLATHKYRALTGRDLHVQQQLSGGEEQQGQQQQGKGDPQYAALIFDHMAPEFERRLVKDLQYDCPWRMKQLLGEASFTLSISHPSYPPLLAAAGSMGRCDADDMYISIMT